MYTFCKMTPREGVKGKTEQRVQTAAPHVKTPEQGLQLAIASGCFKEVSKRHFKLYF